MKGKVPIFLAAIGKKNIKKVREWEFFKPDAHKDTPETGH